MSCITNKSNASQENNSARVDWLHCARRLAFLCVFLHSRMTVWETSPPFPTRSPDSTCQEPALTNTGSEAHSTRKAMYKPQRDIYAYSASVLKSHCHDLVISELEERRIINCLHSPNNSSVVLEVPAQHSFKSLHALPPKDFLQLSCLFSKHLTPLRSSAPTCLLQAARKCIPSSQRGQQSNRFDALRYVLHVWAFRSFARV